MFDRKISNEVNIGIEFLKQFYVGSVCDAVFCLILSGRSVLAEVCNLGIRGASWG